MRSSPPCCVPSAVTPNPDTGASPHWETSIFCLLMKVHDRKYVRKLGRLGYLPIVASLLCCPQLRTQIPDR
jgi:hypothetical protein